MRLLLMTFSAIYTAPLRCQITNGKRIYYMLVRARRAAHARARIQARVTRFDYFRNRINTSVAVVVIKPLLSFGHSVVQYTQ